MKFILENVYLKCVHNLTNVLRKIGFDSRFKLYPQKENTYFPSNPGGLNILNAYLIQAAPIMSFWGVAVDRGALYITDVKHKARGPILAPHVTSRGP